MANFIDSHVYVCRRAVLDLIVDRAKQFESFREDFIPWLCKLQYQRRRREKFTAGTVYTSCGVCMVAHCLLQCCLATFDRRLHPRFVIPPDILRPLNGKDWRLPHRPTRLTTMVLSSKVSDAESCCIGQKMAMLHGLTTSIAMPRQTDV